MQNHIGIALTNTNKHKKRMFMFGIRLGLPQTTRDPSSNSATKADEAQYVEMIVVKPCALTLLGTLAPLL